MSMVECEMRDSCTDDSSESATLGREHVLNRGLFSSTGLEQTSNQTVLSNMELSLYFGGCPLLMSNVEVCFCCGDVFEEDMKHMHDLVTNSFQWELDILLSHWTPFTSAICSSLSGTELMNSIITRASPHAVCEFVERVPILCAMPVEYACPLWESIFDDASADVRSKMAGMVAWNRKEFVALAKHPITNYSMQKAVEAANDADFGSILEIICEIGPNLSVHRHGAFVFQAVLKKLAQKFACGRHDKQVVDSLRKIVRAVLSLGVALMLNRYGNFTAQEIVPLLRFDPGLAHEFARVLEENFKACVLNRFGHCVIEAFLSKSDVMSANRILVGKFLSLDTSEFLSCVDTAWGKYVVVKLWRNATALDQQRINQKLSWNARAHLARFAAYGAR